MVADPISSLGGSRQVTMTPSSAIVEKVDVKLVSLKAISVTVKPGTGDSGMLRGINIESTSMALAPDGSHLRRFPGEVQVNVTLSIGHGLSSLNIKVAELRYRAGYQYIFAH